MENGNGGTHLDRCLSICQFGGEQCAPGHAYGPAARDHYLIHFVVSGKGTLFADGKTFPVSPGESFVIYPWEITYYQADARAPWHYLWVGFGGRDAENLLNRCGYSRETRVLRSAHPESAGEALTQIARDAASLPLGDLAAIGGLCRFFGAAGDGRAQSGNPDEPARYYKKALWYIEGRLERGVTVAELAAFVGLCRSQLFRVFKQACGRSPKEEIQRIRLERALSLLQKGGMSVRHVALSVGYSSGAQLSAALNKKSGKPPTVYAGGLTSQELHPPSDS